MKTGTLELRRSYLDNCTIGKISLDGIDICYTVEKVWLSNIPFKSCVPAGVYELLEHNSPKHGQCHVLKNHNLGVGIDKGDSVRYGCLIHIANFPSQVVGCIAPGLELHPERWGVAHSGSAIKHLRKLLKDDVEWKINII